MSITFCIFQIAKIHTVISSQLNLVWESIIVKSYASRWSINLIYDRIGLNHNRYVRQLTADQILDLPELAALSFEGTDSDSFFSLFLGFFHNNRLPISIRKIANILLLLYMISYRKKPFTSINIYTPESRKIPPGINAAKSVGFIKIVAKKATPTELRYKGQTSIK